MWLTTVQRDMGVLILQSLHGCMQASVVSADRWSTSASHVHTSCHLSIIIVFKARSLHREAALRDQDLQSYTEDQWWVSKVQIVRSFDLQTSVWPAGLQSIVEALTVIGVPNSAAHSVGQRLHE